jgi:hypothetical protein
MTTKKNILYREKDIEAINENIYKIMDEASKKQLETLEPTIKEFHEIMKDIMDFIREKKRIVYGGYGLNILIKNRNKEDVIYDYYKVADTEFFSYTPVTDIVELCDYLYKKGHKYVQAKDAGHAETYKIFVNFINVCDVSYMPKYIFDNMPIIKEDGYLIIHPHMMLLDKFRMFNNPMTASWRFDKEVKRTNLILKYFPLVKIDCTLNKIDFNKDVLDFVRKNVLTKYNRTIITGYYAYYYFMYKSKLEGDDEGIELYVPYYDVICEDLIKDGKSIYEDLKNEFGNDITFKEFYPFFQFHGRRISFYYKNNLILTLFDNFGLCYPYLYLEKKKLNISSFLLTLMYLMFLEFRYLINKEKIDMENHKCMISNMVEARYKFLDENGLTVLDDTPFKDFVLTCIGKTIDPMRESRIDTIKKKEQGKRFGFSYTPPKENNPNFDPTLIKFKNSSGNEIKNSKFRILDGMNEEFDEEE